LEIGTGNPALHQSDIIDYEMILSGKIDIVLETGERRTLTAGSYLVMAGIMHAWENRYDEACVYAAVGVGANREPE
jgi:quercetin dioxygenase-like cupin family protein